MLALYLGVFFLAGCLAVAPATAQTETSSRQRSGAASATADLYRQLGNLPLDPAAVFKIRDASIDREDLHISLNDGTIGFTRAVNGRITGALFVGEGEILIVPPDFTERHSLSMFTKIAVLSERFSLVYLRFADDALLEDLKPHLRAPEDAEGFLSRNHALALSLSEADALRAFMGLTYAPKAKPGDYAGEFLYARVNGEKLGGFDVAYDPLGEEQIAVRQFSYTPRGRYYDIWMAFPMQSIRKRQRSGAGDPVPELVSITDYKIRMDVRPPSDLAGSATLTVRSNQSGARALLFELSRYLKLSSVQLEKAGQPPVDLDFIQNEAIEGSQLSRRGNDTVTVVFPEPLVAGQTLQLKFTYAGSVMSEAGGGLLYVGARGTWYPNRGPAMSNFDMEFRHPADWKLLATGRKAASTEREGFTESRFVSERPMPLAGFNLGKYVSTPVANAATHLEVFSARGVESDFSAARPAVGQRVGRRLPLPATPTLAPDPSQNATKVGRNASQMIDFLSARVVPFPFSSLSITQLPGPNSQGWPGLIFLSSYVFLSKDERQPSRFGNIEVFDWVFDHMMTEHEIAHQWWGNNVFWDSYRDQWLMEALSNYCALQRLEKEDPALVRRLLDQYRDDLLRTPAAGDNLPYKEAGPVRLGLRLNSSRFAEAYTPVVYGRGSWLIHMLRELLRENAPRATRAVAGPRAARSPQPSPDPDALFYSVLRELQTQYAGKKLTTALFLQAFERVLPASAMFEKQKSLDWFYDGWINGSAIPHIKFDSVRLLPAASRVTATGVIVQQDAPETLVTPVPIYAVVEGSAPVFLGRVFADGARTEFRLNAPPGTKRLLLDPNFTVLRQP